VKFRSPYEQNLRKGILYNIYKVFEEGNKLERKCEREDGKRY